MARIEDVPDAGFPTPELALLDEHLDAYKDIDAVMAAQRDLVSLDHTLHQVLNYKGT